MLLLFVQVFFFNYSLFTPPPPPGITWNIKTLNDFINPFLLIFSESIPGFFLNIINLKEILPYLNNHVHLITMCYKMIFFYNSLLTATSDTWALSFTYWHLLHNVIIGVDIYMYRCILTYSKIKEVSMSFHQG